MLLRSVRVFYWEHKVSGLIYVLTNVCMPNLVKMGMTRNHPLNRASELYTTGVPAPFALEFAIWVEDPLEVEKEVHDHFEHCRQSNHREFFRVDVDSVVLFITEAYLLPGYAVASPELVVEHEMAERLQRIAGLGNALEAVELLRILPESAIGDAGERYAAWKRSHRLTVAND